MKTTHKIRPLAMGVSLTVWLFLIAPAHNAHAFDFKDVISISAAYTTHLFFHEMGHHVVAQEVGADSPRMNFFTRRGGTFNPGLSTYEDIPKESRLPYAVGGERMTSLTFEYALESYRDKPSTYNKALIFFGCADFLAYTLLANYVNTDADMYDPNLIREEIGCSKEALLSLVLAKSLLNTYKVMNPEANFSPVIWADKTSVALLLRFPF